MKYLIFFLLFFSFEVDAQKWVRQNPYPVITELNDISLDKDGYGWVVGDNGVILQTIDGGDVWSLNTNNFTTEDWTHVFHIPGSEGKEVIIGGEEIWMSLNGGMNWEKANLDLGPVVDFQIFTSAELLIVGENKIAISEDGGVSWNVTEGASQEGHSISHFLDILNGWVVINDSHQLFATRDGGQTWTEINSDPINGQTPRSILFRDQKIGFAFGEYFYGTTDGGTTWTEISSSLAFRTISDFLIGENGNFYASNTSGGVLVSMNEGEAWRDQTQLKRPSKSMRSMIEVNRELWTVGNYISIVKSNDEFTTWIDKIPGSKDLLREIEMYDENYGLAGGNGGNLVRTENGGNSWEIIELPEPTSTIWGIDIVDKNEAWLVGTNYVYKSEDGGKTWSVNYDQSPQANTDIYKHINGDLFFTHTRRKIYRSVDQGNSWNIVHDQGSGSNFGRINFVSENVGFASGYGSYVVKTVDGGQTWNQLTPPGSGNESLTGSTFVDENKGWVYSSRNLFITLDGGQTWSSESLPTTLSYIFYFNFENQQLGYAMGRSTSGKSTLLKTENAGDQWEVIYESDISNYSYSLAPGPKNKIWLAGQGGNIEVSAFCDEAPSIENLMGPDLVCIGDQVEFEIEATNSVEFVWTYPNDWIVVGNSNSSKITLSIGASSGSVSIAASNTCEFSDTLSVDVQTIEPITDVQIQRLDSVISTSVQADSFQWYLNGIAITGAVQSSFRVTQNGAYRVKAFREPCDVVSSNQITVNITSTWNIADYEWDIYPNPGIDHLYIQTELDQGVISICTMDGKVILSKKITQKQTKLNFQEIQAGIYIIEIRDGEKWGIKKWVVR